MFLKEFIKLNVNIDMIIQKREKCKIKTMIVSDIFNIGMLKLIY